MRIAFLAETAAKGQDATERRRVAHLWRALIRMEHAFPEFIDANQPCSISQGSRARGDGPKQVVWDVVVNATNDPNAADAFYAAANRIWVPPSDASAVNPHSMKNCDATWLWEDGPSNESQALADHILPDIYETALDHSIATYPEGAILADSSIVENQSHGIVELLKANPTGETGLPVELTQLLAPSLDFDQCSIVPYENLEALGRASVLISDFSPAYRELAFTALNNGAKAILVGTGKYIVLGGRRYGIPQSDDELIAGEAMGWSSTQQRTFDDLTRSVKSALQSITSGTGFYTAELDNSTVFECELKRHSFNPHTGLLIAFVSCRCPFINDMIFDGLAVISGDTELPDVRCRRNAPADIENGLLLRIVAFLPAGLSVQDVNIQILVEGVISYDVALPPTITFQQAGFLCVESAGEDRWAVEHWSASSKTWIDCSDGEVIDQSIVPNATGLHFCRSTIRIDTQDNRMTAQPDEGVGQTLFGSGRYMAPQSVSSDRLVQLKDAYRGQSAWLIGNGPSVRPADLDRLQGRLCFAFNRFHLAYSETCLRPQFTLCSDRQTIEDFFEEIVAQAGGMVMLAQADRPDKSGAAEWLRVAPVFPPLFSKNPAVRVSAGGSSPFIAMQVAHYLGIRRLYLYGMDFTYKVRKNALSKDPMRGGVGEGNHFITDYRAGLPWSPPNTLNILMAFLTAREIFAADGGSIRNATRGGALEMFERYDFEKALRDE
ncbi:hypothetical protein [Parasphingopyxis lamellibrachiae]|uniref:DUF115 domain-containing protein n=1 Tax=Parasphingopyxis lamellibrachiae TaxID=680125 RepID=A0A3D9FEG5_9SPHN|nr:hypothetical protein [Parasphingopyxis lamellibrachiae]RED16179.1 hypothetical protein DFR46_1195 [Parasphingopyxis lamellibrachiae]